LDGALAPGKSGVLINEYFEPVFSIQRNVDGFFTNLLNWIWVFIFVAFRKILSVFVFKNV
jgi:hypothetical protein